MRCEVLTGKPPSITFTFKNEGPFTASINGKYSHKFTIVDSVDNENINANPPQIKSILLLLLLFNSNWWVYNIFKAVYWNSRVFILFIIIFSDIKIEKDKKQDTDIILNTPNTPFTLSFYYVFIFIYINSIVIMNYVLLLR